MKKEEELRIREKAQCLFDSGWNCSETVVKTVCEEMGMNSDVPVRIASPLGSGMSKNGATCGALNGAFICFGLFNGRSTPEDMREPSYEPADKVFNQFVEKYGSFECKVLTGLDFRNPELMAENKPRMHKELCGPMVQQIVIWVLEELDYKEKK